MCVLKARHEFYCAAVVASCTAYVTAIQKRLIDNNVANPLTVLLHASSGASDTTPWYNDHESRPIYRQGSYHLHLKVPPSEWNPATQRLLSIRHRKSDLGIKKLGATCFREPSCLVMEITSGANRPSEEQCPHFYTE